MRAGGDESAVCIALLPLSSAQTAIPQHNGAHTAFGVDKPTFRAWQAALPALLQAHRCGAEQAVSIDEHDYGMQLSLFFADPDNNILEITTWVDPEDPGRL